MKATYRRLPPRQPDRGSNHGADTALALFYALAIAWIILYGVIGWWR